MFLTAIGFALIAVYLYWNETNNDVADPTPPAADPGLYTLAQVKTAFDEQDLTTEFGRDTADTEQIPGIRGQPITVNGADVYVFVFSGDDGPSSVTLAEEAFATTDEATIALVRRSTDEIGADLPKRIVQGSNIIAVMVGGEDDDFEKVQAAIEGLP